MLVAQVARTGDVDAGLIAPSSGANVSGAA